MPSHILAFDFGMKHIGVAVAETLLKQATPLPTLPARRGVPDWEAIQQLISEWGVGTIVVGIPLHLDGRAQAITFAAKRFAKNLEKRFSLPVCEVDERLTTIEARQQIFDQGGYKKLRNTDIDSVAAQLILEQWLAEQSA